MKLAVLGTYTTADPYQRAVMDAASDEVVFLGAIYDPETVAALRFHSVAYLHGHTVGGTNPSLVEAMAAGNAVIAHDNEYNKSVTHAMEPCTSRRPTTPMRASPPCSMTRSDAPGWHAASRTRHAEEFTWTHVAGQYEELLRRSLDPANNARQQGEQEDVRIPA